MISFSIILFILLTHWIADFVFQTDYLARNKSKSNKVLALHVLIYTSLFLPFTLYAFWDSPENILPFIIITYVLHFVIDHFTSRVTSKLSSEGKYGSDTIPNFGMFSIIGLDQLLHYISLFGLYIILQG